MDEPIANSSMFVLPSSTTPASRSRRVTVASYGGRQLPRMREAQVVGMSAVVKTSLRASGTPASGPSTSPAARRSSTARAAARALSAATCRKACSSLVDRVDAAQVGVGHFQRGHLAARDRRGEFRRRHPGQPGGGPG